MVTDMDAGILYHPRKNLDRLSSSHSHDCYVPSCCSRSLAGLYQPEHTIVMNDKLNPPTSSRIFEERILLRSKKPRFLFTASYSVTTLVCRAFPLHTIWPYFASVRHVQIIRGLPGPQKYSSLLWLLLTQTGVHKDQAHQGQPRVQQRLPVVPWSLTCTCYLEHLGYLSICCRHNMVLIHKSFKLTLYAQTGGQTWVFV